MTPAPQTTQSDGDGQVIDARSVHSRERLKVVHMFPDGSTFAEQWCQLEGELSLENRLQFGYQDLGVVNSDGKRVAEFAEFFTTRYSHTWLPATVDEFVDLVLESACDAIHDGVRTVFSFLDPFLLLAGTIAPERMTYWTDEDWPIAEHLRDRGLP